MPPAARAPQAHAAHLTTHLGGAAVHDAGAYADDDSDESDRTNYEAGESDPSKAPRNREDRRKTAHNVQERKRAHRLTSVILAIQRALEVRRRACNVL